MSQHKGKDDKQLYSMEQYDCLKVYPTSCEINGQNIDADQYDYIYRCIETKLLFMRQCVFCSTELLTAESKMYKDEIYQEISQFSQLWSCPNCAYWHWYNRYLVESFFDDNDSTDELLSSTACISKMREFDSTLPEGCESELAITLRRNNKIWHTINPYKFEKFVGSIFKANFADCDVMHVGKSNDGGVDLIFIDSQKHQWLIQVKRRESPISSEGVSTVRNLLGAMYLKDCLRGIIVSTSDHFTFRAYEAVARAKELGRIVELIDRGKLHRMLNPLIPDRPWQQIIEAECIELNPTKDFARQIRKSVYGRKLL
jgi:hypothetical protein